jgi:hypothetical protein
MRRRVREFSAINQTPNAPYSSEQLALRCAKMANTRAPCSCWMCGNPRRYRNGPRQTMQELRAAQDIGAD